MSPKLRVDGFHGRLNTRSTRTSHMTDEVSSLTVAAQAGSVSLTSHALSTEDVPATSTSEYKHSVFDPSQLIQHLPESQRAYAGNMAVIWGLDLHDMQWAKFKSSYMFRNNDYYLRRTKFIVYQCAMIFCVVSESLGTAVLSDYIDQQSDLERQFGISLYNDDYIGIASYNIFIGITIATVFGAAFFFDLFWPTRYEPAWVQRLWQSSAVFVCVAGLADTLAFTIIVCLRGEVLTYHGIAPDQLSQLQAQIASQHTKTPIIYRDGARTIASVVFLWVGWACTVASTVIMLMFYSHVRRTGTAKSPHLVKEEKSAETEDETKTTAT